MNNKTILVIAVILAFSTGFISSQMIASMHISSPPVINANGTQIMVINDDEYYPVVIREIKNANVSIHIIMYEIRWYGDPQNDTHEVSNLMREVIKAHERGVEVKIILEDGSTYGEHENKEIKESNENWSKYLERKGIEVKFDKSDVTTHDKLVIIDEYVVILGSTNWSESALKYNHEADVMLRGKKVAEEYEEYFETLWKSF